MSERKPRTFVSTFHLTLKSQTAPLSRFKKTENGQTTDKTLMGHNKPGASTVTDVKETEVRSPDGPHFQIPLNDCTISAGSDAVFQAVIAGSRPLSASWLHNGSKVRNSDTSFINGVASLTLSKCNPGDAGTYTCVVENVTGKESCSARLYITGKVPSIDPHCNHKQHQEREITDLAFRPTRTGSREVPPVEFLEPPEHVEVRVGEPASLCCEFRSCSTPVACCWIFNRDDVLQQGPRMSVSSSESRSSLQIPQTRSGDTGSYTLVVRNRQGSAQHTVSLSVIDRPEPPASHPVVSQLSTQSLVLSWMGPSYDGGSAVQGYIVEMRREGLEEPGSWTRVASRCKSTSYQVSAGLEPEAQYRFRVRAYNAAGVSEPSQQSDCVTMSMTKEEKETYVTVTIDTKHKVRDHYDVLEKLGFGKFGQVFKLAHKESGQVCAGKFFKSKTSAARQEIKLMNRLHHPRLVQCLAAYDTRSELVMVMEYIAGGELFERLVDDNFEHTELTSARYVRQILEGMQFVHKQNIVHLDLKPENIVCVDTTGTQIKIIDFGLASTLEEGKPLMVMHGTPEYVAPEVINYEPVSLKTDMWSIGVICFLLLCSESPFQGNSDHETYALVTAARYEFDEESSEVLSDQAKDFIRALLQKDQRCRLSCTEALLHPWIVSFTPLCRRQTKSLNKQKMRRFLAKRKWKKTGKAVLALQRMSNLSSRPDSPGGLSEDCHIKFSFFMIRKVLSPPHHGLFHAEPCWSPAAEEAIQSLDKQLQSEPRFQQPLKDVAFPRGATASLTCRVNGYPLPEVKWLHNEMPVCGSSRVAATVQDDGSCSLVLSDLEPSDSGVYVCRASNKAGHAMCSAQLRVSK
ncbi:myosin light chain kinase, smooth muscle-like [Neosynchiropus ocellatus]